MSHCVLVLRDVVFEEGQPRRTSADVREEPLLFDMNIVPSADNGNKQVLATKVLATANLAPIVNLAPVHQDPDQQVIPVELCQSTRLPQLMNTRLLSLEYQKHEDEGKGMGKDWATNTQNPRASMVTDCLEDNDILACLADTRSSHLIPHSYKYAIAMDKEQWTLPTMIKMDTLKSKHTWDLIKPPPGANIMDSMWVYDIKQDGEGN